MFDAAGEVLYVGKARDLKKRVVELLPEDRARVPHRGDGRRTSRAWRRRSRARRARRCCSRTTTSRRTSRATTSSIRDDKSYPYVCISGDAFPQLRFHRGALDRRNRYFGPFPERGRRARRHRHAAEGVPCCARARTPCSPTARGPACCTRSSAAPRRASAASARPTIARTSRARRCSCAARPAKC